jgi:hypothetical protein
MISKNLITLLLLWTGLLLASLVSAQDEATATDPADEKANKGSQETEYSDDNYRRFMELKDEPTRTSTLPTNSYQSGTEKLDELPEASQKHLRNQLREIILESDEWAPGDENGEYPFVASEAGEKNPELKQQEVEAWGELVGKYHEREAQIYANAERSDSAAGTDGGQSGSDQAQAESGESAGSEGSNTGEDVGKGEQKRPGQEGQSAQTQAANNGNEGSDSSSASANAGDPNAISTAGVSQSALEYLTGGSQQQNQQQAESSETGQSGSPSEQSAAQQAMAQQQTPAESAMAESQSQSQQQSAQQQNSEQQDQQQATQQDASEFVVISKGTLSIKELQNAKGITISTGGNSIPEPPPRKKDDG